MPKKNEEKNKEKESAAEEKFADRGFRGFTVFDKSGKDVTPSNSELTKK